MLLYGIGQREGAGLGQFLMLLIRIEREARLA